METSAFHAALEPTERIYPLGVEPRPEYFEARWYAAYTYPNHEKHVAQQMERRSVEHFLPLYQSLRRWKDRRVRLQLPLFPGYVFVQIALRHQLQVLQIAGVARLVGFDGHPTPIPIEDIEAIRGCLAGRCAMQPYPYVKRGQLVRVMSGPLAGLTGIVVRQRSCMRFVISLELLQRSVAVEIDASDFDPHAAPHA